MRRTVGFVLSLLGGVSGRGDAQDSARLVWTQDAIRLDGAPDEPAWRSADSITDFIQRDPDEGRPATERTVVRLLAAARGLYVGVWAFDSRPEAIRHAQLRRDADLDSDDQFSVILDPQRDRRSGYVFSVNPNGVLRDAEMLTFERSNTDWNGVWDARARRGSEGWTAELFIPWQTLRYRRDPGGGAGGGVWGVNFRRIIRRKNEETLWRAWRRTEGLLFLERAGTVAGFSGLPPRGRVELRPYAAATGELRELAYGAGGNDSVVALADQSGKAGLDAKVAAGPTLTLDLTVNTDFAQVEADRQVVNLTRFPLFFPEQRPFFLESSGIFAFGQSERAQVFHSRRIGLDSTGAAVPLTAGIRLTGRVGREQIGLLAVRTGDGARALDLVARVKHDVLTRGSVGAILTSQSGPDVPATRLAGGADFTLPFLVGDGQNLVLGGFAAGTRDSASAQTATAWRLYADYPNDVMDNFIGVSRIEGGFDPALGFVLETDALRHTAHFDLFPRPHRLGIRRLHFKPIEWEVVTHLDGSPSHAAYEATPLGGEFNGGDEFGINLQRFEDVPPDSFEIFPGHVVPPGRYWYNRVEIEFSSSAGRPLGVDVGMSVGDFYTGRATEITGTLTVRLAPHVVTEVEGEQQAARLATGRFTARTGRARVDVAASPRLGGTLFLQGDNETRRLTVNARLHWIPAPGSDAYLVWNSAWPTGFANGIPWRQPQRGALVGKLVYYFRL